MKNNRSVQPALGVSVTSRDVLAVLLQPGSPETKVLRSFALTRNTRHSAPQPAAAGGLAGISDDSSGNDFTIQFGDGVGSGGELFLKSEFTGLDSHAREGADSVEAAQTFAFELSEILEQCRENGYADPVVGFCLNSSDISHVEVRVTETEGQKKKKKNVARKKGNGQVTRSLLVDLLKEQHDVEVDKEQLAFLPMTPTEEGEQRYLALFPKTGNSFLGTLEIIKSQKDQRMPLVRLCETEVSLYLGFARKMLRDEAERKISGDSISLEQLAAKPSNTLVVRTGADDTMVMFLKGDVIQQYESMRSLTAFDSPDTICSRVLLLQDEFGVDEIQHVLVLSEERETDLIESFQMFFPDADIRSIRDLVNPGEAEITEGAMLPAVSVGIRLLNGEQDKGIYEPVNLLPKKYARRSFHISVDWYVPAMVVLLFVTAFFFGGRFVVLQTRIAGIQEELRKSPPELTESDVHLLQSRIDSLHTAYKGYMHALDVLDTLLIGSDRWSRALEEVSRHAAAVQGIWIEGWSPTMDVVQITGNATSRDRVVAFADRIGADIESLVFSEIRDVQVYAFSMRMRMKRQLPEAAVYLREKALEDLKSSISSGTSVVPTSTN